MAAITYARQRLGWQVMERLMEEAARQLAGQDQQSAFVSGMRPAAVDRMCPDLPDNLVPGQPGRRYERKTKRPGGRYKICKPGQTAIGPASDRLSDITRMAAPTVTIERTCRRHARPEWLVIAKEVVFNWIIISNMA